MLEGSGSTGSTIEAPDALSAAGYVEFVTAGDPAIGEFRCSGCGYGVIVQRGLPPCPMCGGTAWERAPWRPFSREPLH